MAMERCWNEYEIVIGLGADFTAIIIYLSTYPYHFIPNDVVIYYYYYYYYYYYNNDI